LALPAWPQVDFAKFGPVETQPMSRIKEDFRSGPASQLGAYPARDPERRSRHHRARSLPQEHGEEAQKQGVKLTPLALIMKAVVAALKITRSAIPRSRPPRRADPQTLLPYRGCRGHTGRPVVPVIRDVDQKGVLQTGEGLGEASAKARDGKLGPADMQGGSFSISSLAESAAPLHADHQRPEVAILAYLNRQPNRCGRTVNSCRG